MTEANSNPAGEPAPQSERTPRSELLTNILVLVVLAVAAVVWWDFFKKPVLFVVTLGILVAVHEWGHFIAAKSVGVHVYEFALGFGPKLVTYMRRGGTDYTIRAIPLGGFVNPKGMQPDDPITPDGLNGRRPAERALVYLAGPLMNIILGVGVFCLMGFLIGSADPGTAYIGEVRKGTPATRMQVVRVNGQMVTDQPAGLRVADKILAVNGTKVGALTVVNEIHPNPGRLITMTVQRGADTLELTGTPERRKSEQAQFLVVTEVPDALRSQLEAGDQLDQVGTTDVESVEEASKALQEKAGQLVTLGLWRGGDRYLKLEITGQPIPLATRPGERWVGQLGFGPSPGMGPRVSLARSAEMGVATLRNYFLSMGALFTKPKQLGESVGGPIQIFGIMGPLDKLPPIYYFGILAQLSLSLAIFNLLPVPVLDGGHMLLLTVEVLRRRRLEPETQRTVAMVGLALIGILFVYITWKDIIRNFLS